MYVLYSGALGLLSASMDITGMIISWYDIGLRATYAPGFDRGWGGGGYGYFTFFLRSVLGIFRYDRIFLLE